MKVAILGGSFDPIHNGHLQMAKYAKKRLQVKEVWFIPTWKTPLKERELTNYSDRYRMIQRAIKPYRYMKVKDVEKQLQPISYTIDTIKTLKKQYPSIEFSFLVGGDQVKQLDHWKDIDLLAKEVEICAFPRREKIASKYVHKYVLMPPIAVSSTDIRNGYLWSFLPNSVKRYIGEHFMYMEEIVKHHMSSKRYEHSIRVAKLCQELAQYHHLSTTKAYYMGILHDICKEREVAKNAALLNIYDPKTLTLPKGIWHGSAGSLYLRKYYDVFDRDVLFAIKHHVLGSDKNIYAMLLYIADKLEPNRDYDTKPFQAMARIDLNKAYLETKFMIDHFLEELYAKTS